MSIELFHLPDVGEGLTEAEIVAWHVDVGDTVVVNQAIVDIETAKSVVELPAPHAGTIAELLVAPGETVDVGKPIIAIQTSNDAARPDPSPEGVARETADEPKLLVGYGARESTGGRRRRGGGAGSGVATAPAAAAAPSPHVGRKRSCALRSRERSRPSGSWLPYSG